MSPTAKSFTSFEKSIVRGILELDVGLAVVVEMETVGRTPSTTKALFVPSEPTSARFGKVSTAALPDPSRMLPLLRANALVEA